MHRKPIILILTSRDERAGLSKNLADSIKKIGTHNVVVISDDKRLQGLTDLYKCKRTINKSLWRNPAR